MISNKVLTSGVNFSLTTQEGRCKSLDIGLDVG
jgi:hypothetical protein